MHLELLYSTCSFDKENLISAHIYHEKSMFMKQKIIGIFFFWLTSFGVGEVGGGFELFHGRTRRCHGATRLLANTVTTF